MMQKSAHDEEHERGNTKRNFSVYAFFILQGTPFLVSGSSGRGVSLFSASKLLMSCLS